MASQRGSSLPVFTGVNTYQPRPVRGNGLGSALRGVLKLAAPALKTVGKRLLRTGAGALDRLITSRLGGEPEAETDDDDDAMRRAPLGSRRRRRKARPPKARGAFPRKSRRPRPQTSTRLGVNRRRVKKRPMQRVRRAVGRTLRTRQDVFG